LLTTAILAAALAVSEPAGFLDRTYRSPDGTAVKYAVFVPRAAKPGAKLPVILALHGSGECGTDGKRQLEVGFGPAVRARAKDFPFLVVFPQAQRLGLAILDTWYADRPAGEQAVAILNEVMKEFPVDPKRVYLTGNSMGGFGTWSLAHKHPGRWAAIAPVCGGGNPVWAAALKDTPVWCFHGEADEVVPVDHSRSMVKALQRVGNPARYDEYAGVIHDSWTRAYATDALYDWMLSHTLKSTLTKPER
jgi:predicted peptidase